MERKSLSFLSFPSLARRTDGLTWLWFGCFCGLQNGMQSNVRRRVVAASTGSLLRSNSRLLDSGKARISVEQL